MLPLYLPSIAQAQQARAPPVLPPAFRQELKRAAVINRIRNLFIGCLFYHDSFTNIMLYRVINGKIGIFFCQALPMC